MVNMNPMQLNLNGVSAPKFIQPGGPEFGNVDIGQDLMSCPIDGNLCKRIGSTSFNWRCNQCGNQFDFVPGGDFIFMQNGADLNSLWSMTVDANGRMYARPLRSAYIGVVANVRQE
jgi:hypothetical protein